MRPAAYEVVEMDFPNDLDDAEDFQLSKSELIDRFGPVTSEHEVSKAIAARVPDKTRK